MESNNGWEGGIQEFWKHFKYLLDYLLKKDNQEESWKKLMAKQVKKIEEFNKQ